MVKTYPGPTKNNTCAAVITYFPDNEILLRLKRIQKQVPEIIIIDNASSENCLSILREFSRLQTVQLLENNKNEGIGKALNQASAVAIKSGFYWMLTLDQDTVINDDMFEILVAIYHRCNHRSPLIGSNYWSTVKNKKQISCPGESDNAFIEQRTLITSGTLMKLELIKSIGGFREDYFIDSVDHEYCLRARANNFPVVISCKSLMSHSIGQLRTKTNRFQAFEHPPIRKYYIARNTLVTLKNYFNREPVWAIRQILRLATEFTSIILFEQDKKNKSYAFIQGIIDGIRNKMGNRE